MPVLESEPTSEQGSSVATPSLSNKPAHMKWGLALFGVLYAAWMIFLTYLAFTLSTQ